MLEFEPGDDALSPVTGDLELEETEVVGIIEGGGETGAEAEVEVNEAIEKWAAAAAAAAGNKKGILGWAAPGCEWGGGRRWGWGCSGWCT